MEYTEEIKNIMNEIKNTKNNVAIVAPAGTGKTTLIRDLVENDHNKKYMVLAPTGVAAENIGGRTYHSTLKMPFSVLTDSEMYFISKPRDEIKNVDVLILEEISMIRADHFDAIEYIFRKSKGKEEFFGGVQVVLVGDPHQLKPIVNFDYGPNPLEYEKIFKERYKGPYFFNSLCFDMKKFKWFKLTKIFRQDDPVFINNLNRIRIGDVDNYLVDYFNTRYDPFFDVSKDDSVVISTSIYYKKFFNEKALKLLDGIGYVIHASIAGNIKINSTSAEQYLLLKKDAKIMMVKNDSEKRWVNGTLGKIINIYSDHLEVLINGKIYEVKKNKWSNMDHRYDKDTGEMTEVELGSVIQFPVALGYAFTDKKVQGLTFSGVAIHTGSGLYDSGQAYNILSRCKTFENIHLLTKLKRSDFIVDEKVIEFMKKVDEIRE